MQEVELLEQRARRQDLLVDEGLIEAFYDRWIPQEVCDFDGLRTWWRAAVRDQPSLLFLKRADLMRHQAEGVTTEAFPSVLEQGGIRLAVGYRFEPGSQDDGMSVTIPLASLNQVDVVRLDWLVPGMLKEKVTALLKSLPQRIRRHCIPLPDYVEAFCGRWHDRPGEMPLRKALAQDLREAKAWRWPWTTSNWNRSRRTCSPFMWCSTSMGGAWDRAEMSWRCESNSAGRPWLPLHRLGMQPVIGNGPSGHWSGP